MSSLSERICVIVNYITSGSLSESTVSEIEQLLSGGQTENIAIPPVVKKQTAKAQKTEDASKW